MPLLESLESRNLFAFAGTIDPTFGNAGRNTLQFGNRSLDSLFGSTVQPDGKVILVGSTNSDSGTGTDIAVVRLNPDATLDTTFGGIVSDQNDEVLLGGGLFQIGLSTSNDSAYGVAVQPDGKILIAGAIADDGGTGSILSSQAIVIRLLPDGTPDPDFGGGFGFVSLKLAKDITNPGNSEARAIALQSDGKIIIAGAADFNAFTNEANFAVARLNTNGSTDFSFGEFGSGVEVDGIDGVFTEAYGVAIVPDSQAIILTGTAISPGDGVFTSTTGIFVTAKLNRDGIPDQSFGNGGAVATVFQPYDSETVVPIASTVTLQPDGKIITSGVIVRDDSASSGFGFAGFAVVRYNADGTPDTSFGGRASQLLGTDAFDAPGTVETYFAGNGVNAFAIASQVNILPDGKLLVSGKASLDSNSNDYSNTAIARYRSDGTLDTTFNGNGKVLLSPTGIIRLAAAGNASGDFGSFTKGSNSAVAVVPGGGILVLAQTASDITATRLIGDGADLTSSVTTIKPGTYLGGTKATLSVKFSNQGNIDFNGTVPITLKLSTDRTLSSDDSAIPLTLNSKIILKPGASKVIKVNFVFPIGEFDGQFFVLASANDNKASSESNFLNNISAAPNAVTLAPAYIDLSAELIVAPPSPLSAKKKAAFSIKLVNNGTILAKGSILLQLLSSLDDTESSDDLPLLGSKPSKISVKAKGSSIVKFSTALPTDMPAGTYNLILKLDASSLSGRTPLRTVITGKTLTRV